MSKKWKEALLLKLSFLLSSSRKRNINESLNLKEQRIRRHRKQIICDKNETDQFLSIVLCVLLPDSESLLFKYVGGTLSTYPLVCWRYLWVCLLPSLLKVSVVSCKIFTLFFCWQQWIIMLIFKSKTPINIFRNTNYFESQKCCSLMFPVIVIWRLYYQCQ